MENICFLSLGTNIGNKLEHLTNAISKLQELANVLSISSIYQTPSWGFNSDDFFNLSVKISTKKNAITLLKELQNIEKELGRVKNNNIKGYQARPIDIDILFFNDEIITLENLEIPHPRIQDRKFVLIPTLEINTNFKHPVFHKSLEELLEVCTDNSNIKLVGKLPRTNHL